MVIKNKEVKDPQGKNLRGRSKINQYIRHRPSDNEISDFSQICFNYWNSLMENFRDINTYVTSGSLDSTPFRNKTGGSLVFRPVALLPFVRASIRIKELYKMEFSEVFINMSQMPLILDNPIWKNVLWKLFLGVFMGKQILKIS